MNTFVTSREFNQNASEVKRAATKGPVIITDRGSPAHVLLSFAEYRRLTESRRTIVDLLSMPLGAEADFDPVKADNFGLKSAEF